MKTIKEKKIKETVKEKKLINDLNKYNVLFSIRPNFNHIPYKIEKEIKLNFTQSVFNISKKIKPKTKTIPFPSVCLRFIPKRPYERIVKFPKLSVRAINEGELPTDMVSLEYEEIKYQSYIYKMASKDIYELIDTDGQKLKLVLNVDGIIRKLTDTKNKEIKKIGISIKKALKIAHIDFDSYYYTITNL